MDIQRIYVAAGYDVDQTVTWRDDGSRSSPLIKAVRNGHLRTVKYLINKVGAKVNAVDPFKRTALHHCCEVGHMNVLKFMIEHGNASMSSRDSYENTCLHIAATNRHVKILKYLLEKYTTRLRKLYSSVSFKDTMQTLYNVVLATRLSQYERQEFRKEWFEDTMRMYYDNTKRRDLVVPPTTFVMRRVRKYYDHKPKLEHFESHEDLCELASHVMIESFVNWKNRAGRTALCAVLSSSQFEDKQSQEVCRILIDDYGSYVDEDSKDTYNRDAEQQLGYYDTKDVTDNDVMMPSHKEMSRPWYWLLRSTMYLCQLAGWEERLHPSTGRLLYVPIRRHGANDMYYDDDDDKDGKTDTLNHHRVVWEKPDAVLEYEGMAGGQGSKFRWQYRLRHAIEVRTISVWRQLRYKNEPDFYYNIFTKQCQYEIPKEIEEMGEVVDGLDGDQSMVAMMETSMNTGTLRRGRQKRKKRLEKKSHRFVALRQGKWEETWCPKRRQFVYICDPNDDDNDDDDLERRTKLERPISFVVDDDQLENVLSVQPDLSPPFLRGRHHAVLCILRGARARSENRMVLCEWGCGKWMVCWEEVLNVLYMLKRKNILSLCLFLSCTYTHTHTHTHIYRYKVNE